MLLTPVWFSLGNALANPGLGTAVAARGAGWFRGHGGSGIVARTQRTPRRPAKGAALLAIGAILCAGTAGCGHAAHPGQPTAMTTEHQPGSPDGGPIPLP